MARAPVAEEDADRDGVDQGLQRDLSPPRQAFRVVLRKLEPVVEEADDAVTKGDGDDGTYGGRTQVREEGRRHSDAQEDERAAHRRGALLRLMGSGSVLADVVLPMLGEAQPVDQSRPDQHADHQSRHPRSDDSERRVFDEVKKARRWCSPEVLVEQVNHGWTSAKASQSRSTTRSSFIPRLAFTSTRSAA